MLQSITIPQYILYIILSKMMQIIDDHLLLSPQLKGDVSTTCNSCISETRSNASVDSHRSRQDQNNTLNKVYKNDNAKAKSSLCRNFMEKGSCPYGSKCQFAHGLAQLRCNSERQMLYKTRPCNAFLKNSMCMYGTRCNFLHSNEQQSSQWEGVRGLLPGYRQVTSSWNIKKQSTLLGLMGKGRNIQ